MHSSVLRLPLGPCLSSLWRGVRVGFAASVLCSTAAVLPAMAQSAVMAPGQLNAMAAPVPGVAPVPAATVTDGRGSAEQAAAAAPQSEEGGANTDYKIGPNDLLEVEVFGVSELKRTVRVNSTGHISMPLIGLVPVVGLTPSDAEALVALQYGKNYLQDPQVSIFIKEFTTQRITVDGAVVKPGIYPLTGQITLLRALAMAGGGSQLSDLEKVMLFRITPQGQSLVEKHDVDKIRLGEAPDPLLQGDDVVVVNRNSARATLRDSLFRDIIETINPFSSSYRNVAAP